MKIPLLLSLLFLSHIALATPSECFLLYDLNHNTLIEQNNPERCDERFSPACTFNIALSLMAADQHLINHNTIFIWDGNDTGKAVWNCDKTPREWFYDSVYPISKALAMTLGTDVINDYLTQFNYGNQDFSSGAYPWVSGSLKVSANEQLTFLTALMTDALPVSIEAMNLTKDNLYRNEIGNGWKFCGKTGTADTAAWFVGFIEKDEQTYIFVYNYSDEAPWGHNARARVEKLLAELLSDLTE